MTDTFADWLRDNPAPDLQELVRQHGGYNKITPEAWAEWDARVADWHIRYRARQPETLRNRTAASDCAGNLIGGKQTGEK